MRFDSILGEGAVALDGFVKAGHRGPRSVAAVWPVPWAVPTSALGLYQLAYEQARQSLAPTFLDRVRTVVLN